MWRTWDAARSRLLWVLLNPSTADERAEEPTLRRCASSSAGFSHAWGFSGVELVNLFAWRASHRPARCGEPRHRDQWGWGDRGRYQQHDGVVWALLVRPVASEPCKLGHDARRVPTPPAVRGTQHQPHVRSRLVR